jgi:hypothetical protein
MTTTELCELFSAEIANTFDGNKELIKEQLFNGTTTDMTEEQIYSRMALNSIILSANLSAQVVVTGLVSLGVIPKNALEAAKVKPQLHLVKSSLEFRPLPCFFLFHPCVSPLSCISCTNFLYCTYRRCSAKFTERKITL